MIISGKEIKVKGRTLGITHIKDVMRSYSDKIGGTIQGNLLRLQRLGINGAFFGPISLSLLFLSDLGISVTIGGGDGKICFSFPDREFQFKMPYNPASLFNLLEMVRRGANYGFEVLPFGYYPLTKRHVWIDEEMIKIYDGSVFYLESVDPTVITETYFLKIHDNFHLQGKIILDIGAAFGDTAVWFVKAGATVIAVEPANYGWLVKNLSLNEIGAKQVIPLEVAAGVDGYVQIERVSDLPFDGEARIHGINLKHSGQKMNVRSMSIKNIIREAGLDYVDYVKSDCKGCESLFSKEDLDLVKEGVEIECSAKNSQLILDTVKSSGFETRLSHYEDLNHQSLKNNGTVLGRRIV